MFAGVSQGPRLHEYRRSGFKARRTRPSGLAANAGPKPRHTEHTARNPIIVHKWPQFCQCGRGRVGPAGAPPPALPLVAAPSYPGSGRFATLCQSSRRHRTTRRKFADCFCGRAPAQKPTRRVYSESQTKNPRSSSLLRGRYDFNWVFSLISRAGPALRREQRAWGPWREPLAARWTPPGAYRRQSRRH